LQISTQYADNQLYIKGKQVQTSAKEQTIVRTHFEILRILDGDGMIVKNIFTNQEEEVRLLGIDAPELKHCRKLNQDEREGHLPAQFLLELGYKSLNFLIKKTRKVDNVTLIQESKHLKDRYGRTLAYVLLPNGKTLNEILIRQGYAKPYSKAFCSELPIYQKLNLRAKSQGKGLYSLTKRF
jgi:micrococcal nuclease